MKVTIDGQELETDEPLTILHAARRLGIEIPTMCYMDDYDPFTSCMICSVEDVGSGAKLPACTARIADGQQIATQSETIRNFRKLTLDLLLSDHVGDCEAPCTRGCGVALDIPQMIRDIEQDDMQAAIAVVRDEMALPSVLERLCHAPCETPCRRGKYDDPLAIKNLARYASDWDLKREEPHVPERAAESGKRVAIVGGGPSGLSAAHYLAVKGHACTVLEKNPRVLERLREGDLLPDWVVDGELRVLSALGVELRVGDAVGGEGVLEELLASHDAVVLAHGEQSVESLNALGLETNAKGLVVDKQTAKTSQPKVFACGNLVKADKKVLKSFVAGKRIAALVDQFLAGAALVGLPDYYDHSMGKLIDGEIDTFVAGASGIERVEPVDIAARTFEEVEARTEASRCMHCDCREKNNCQLRINSEEYDASQKHFKGPQRATYEHINQDAGAVYEPGKCIKCGCCVHVTRKEGEDFGFAFVGRGFDLKTTVSLGKTLTEGLEHVAEKVVKACPTGALSHNEKLETERYVPDTSPPPPDSQAPESS